MTLIVLCSAKGSPGVTTTALALGLTWPVEADGRVLVVDADPAGADIASGYLQGAAGPGLIGVATNRSANVVDAVAENAVALDASGTRLVVPGSPGSWRGLSPVWSRLRDLADARSDEGLWDVIVDAGRANATDASPVLERADLVVLVVGSSLRAVAAARPVAARLRETRTAQQRVPDSIVLLVVGERRPYPASEVATAVGLRALACIAWDPGAAAVLSDGARPSGRFIRSALMRSAAATARELHTRVETPPVTGRATASVGADVSVVESVTTARAAERSAEPGPRAGVSPGEGVAS